MFISNNDLITRIALIAKINLITRQFFLWVSKIECHGDVDVENTSRRLTNISRLILGKVAISSIGGHSLNSLKLFNAKVERGL